MYIFQLFVIVVIIYIIFEEIWLSFTTKLRIRYLIQYMDKEQLSYIVSVKKELEADYINNNNTQRRYLIQSRDTDLIEQMTKELIMILKCTCQHNDQDKLYGKGMRVHNKLRTDGNRPEQFRCTVCKRERGK